MDVEETLLAIARGIESDARLDSWCKSNYDQAVNVFVSVDGRQLPQSDQCPYVVILPDEFNGGRKSEADFSVEIISTIFDEDAETLPNTRIHVFSGVFRVNEMRLKVQRIVADLDLGRATIPNLNSRFDPFESFPYISVAQRFEFNERYAIGRGDPLKNE